MLAKILAVLARRVLARAKPEIIGITGSFGKSSAKEAIAAILESNGEQVRKTPKNENTELGVPRTIIGGPTGSGVLSWVRTLLIGLKVDYDHYPRTLILEMAAEYPGDIVYLVHLAPPRIGVMTGIGPAHSEFLGPTEKILEEKAPLITALPPDGFAILNADDDLAMSLAHRTRAKIVTYGFGPRAMVRASEVTNDMRNNPGVSATVQYLDQKETFRLAGVLGDQHIYAALAGVAVAIARGASLKVAVNGLARYQPLPGRMRVIRGIKQTTIIDDSYNANPMATVRALEVVSKLEASGARYALLGDMRELGTQSKKYHEEIGRLVYALGYDFFGFVGEMMGHAAAAARGVGMSPYHIFEFHTSREAGEFLRERVRPGDLILIKGSQNQIRMERAVQALMADPDRAPDLLVRQGPEWHIPES